MARSPLVTEELNETASGIFDSLLGPLGLTEEALSKQNEEELRHTIERLDRLIDRPDSLPSLGFVLNVESGRVRPVLATHPSEAQITITPLPELLRRKSLALDLLRQQTSEKRAELISRETASPATGGYSPDEGGYSPDEGGYSPDDSPGLPTPVTSGEITIHGGTVGRDIHFLTVREAELGAEATEATQEAFRLELDRTLATAEAQLTLERGKAEIKTRWWQTRLGRDSIAAIVGGFLLIVFSVTLIVAMFADVAATDIVSNSFLVLLGYFFGAATSARDPDRAQM